MSTVTHISDKAKKGLPSKIHGKGIFAIADITKDEILIVKDGYIMRWAEIETLPFKHLHPELQVAEDLFICPRTPTELLDSLAYINHSCEPNVGMRGDIVAVAMRDIKAGEELTQDYSTIDARDFSFECSCKSPICRHTVTGGDWKDKVLQEKYKGYFSAYLQSKIDGKYQTTFVLS